MRSLLTLSLVALLPVLLFAEDKPKGVQPIKVITLDRKDPVTYEKDIEPILVNKCLFCHSGAVKEGKLDLSTYEGLMKGGKTGKPVVPGKSADSRMVKLCGKTEKPAMPPKNEEPLVPEELALIKLWIDQGAKAPVGVRPRIKPVITALPANVHPVRAVAVSPDKSTVVASRANQIHMYDGGSGTYIRTLLEPNLETSDKKPIKASHLAIVEALTYSPDGKYIASGSYGEVTLWDAQTGMLKQKITGFVDRVVALAFSADGKFLATGGGAPTEDGEIKVFEVPAGKLVVDIKNGHSDTVFGVCFSPDGKMLATCGADKFVKTFELPSGKFIKAFEGHTHHVLDVGWKPDGKHLASCGADNAIKIWDFEKGEQASTQNNAHSKQVTRLVFFGKTGQFLTCSADSTAKMWNINPQGQAGTVRNFAGGTDVLYAIAASPDGAVVASGGEDGVVRLYNGQSGALVKTLLPPGVEPEKPPMPPKK